jgi:hypothetical protein
MKKKTESWETLHFWMAAAMKVFINSLISLLYGLKRAAHIRICVEWSSMTRPDVKLHTPIRLYPGENGCPRKS